MAVIDSEHADRFEHLAGEILKQWQELAVPNEDSPDSKVLSCSIGICQGLATEFDSIDEMIRRADEALYRAKKQGRARYVMA